MEQKGLKVLENSEFGQVRTIFEDGKVLFCAVDIARALGYSNTRDAIGRYCKGVVKHDGVFTTCGERRYLVKGVRRVTIKLTESQRDSLIDFIECNFYPNIQNDDSIDSIDYAIDLLNVYTRLRSAAKQRRRTEAQGRNEASLPLHSKNEI